MDKKLLKRMKIKGMQVHITSTHLQTLRKQEAMVKCHIKLLLNMIKWIALETTNMNVKAASMRLKVLQCPIFRVIIYPSH
jgi:hypothetical protein